MESEQRENIYEVLFKYFLYGNCLKKIPSTKCRKKFLQYNYSRLLFYFVRSYFCVISLELLGFEKNFLPPKNTQNNFLFLIFISLIK